MSEPNDDHDIALKTGIVHLGLGAFHRTHQADYTQDAMEATGGDWGIEAVSMRNPALARAINQNNVFTLLIKQPDGVEFKPISAIRKAYCLAHDPVLVAQRIAAPDIHVITITVTEKGYGLNQTSGGLNLQDPVVIFDLENPNRPKGLLGILNAGLGKRREAGGKGLTLISCDNLPSNGKLLKRLVLEFCKLGDSDLADWIDQNCSFPCSMVDRITPATTENALELAHENLGHDDPLAVETEPFRQWVIEDDFVGPRPAWEQAGVNIVKDVIPFELMKLRMLNGAHSLIAYIGTYLEFSAVRDVMAHGALAELIDQHMVFAGDTLPDIDGFNVVEYRNALKRRFENTAIDHRCIQIAMDGSQKLPQRIFAPAKDRLEAGKTIASFAMATALWMKHIEGKSVFGAAIVLNDPLAEMLQSALNDNINNPADQIKAMS